MKFPVAVICSLACATLVSGQASSSTSTDSAGATKAALPRITLPPDKPAAKSATDAKAKAAADAKAATKAPAKKEETPGKIEGMEIPRGEKGYLGIEIKEATFKLSFYDAKKKPVAADVDRAALRWDPKYKVGEERVVLTPSGDGKSLASAKNIRPPYNFKLYITLIKDATEGQAAVNETFVIDFRQ